ncbi:hypothetical protein [Streptomyces caelestis]|uniref:hypothetical protein n=1 Tax=Streptomyces caelestis TaxID=36816 RepID=UPI0036F5B22D
MSTVLTGHGLTKKYGSTAALDGVDVEAGERDSPALMGPSGSGTSTLLHTLAGTPWPGSPGPPGATTRRPAPPSTAPARSGSPSA